MSRKRRGDEFPDNGFEMWGGYMNAKIAKLEEQFLEQAAKEAQNISSLFSGVSIFVNGYTKPTANELKVMMAEHGGIYHHYFKSDKTKFIVASNLPDTKVKNLPTTKIVKPEWISDSITAGTLLDYKDYLLYSNHSKSQPRLNFRNVSIDTKINVTTNTESNIKHDQYSVNISEHKLQQPLPVTGDKIVKSDESTSLDVPRVSAESGISKCSASAADPNFLSEFYNNSRLHHISQLGAGFKKYVNELRNTSDFNFPARDVVRKLEKVNESFSIGERLPGNKVIMHIDMDCFFVSVGLRKYPQYRGKPVAVTHSKGKAFRSTREGVNRMSEFNMYRNRNKVNESFSIGERLPGNKVIMHIDMDCFFVSVGLRKYPQYRGKPVAVTHSKGKAFRSTREGVNRMSEFNMYRNRNKVNESFSIGERLPGNKVIMHIDMDCFFVSVGLRKYPQYRGKPVAVTHSKGKAFRSTREGVNRMSEFNMYRNRNKKKVEKVLGNKCMADLENINIKSRVDQLSDDEDSNFGSMSEIASCSYEARALGLHNGMFMGPALRLCPNLKTIPYDFEAYKDVAFILYNTVAEYTLDIEAVSCDEMYVDCTELLRDLNMSALEFATILRRQIKEKTGCPCSTGFGANRLQARLATKKAKPDGQYHLLDDDVETYFTNISLSSLPGVGHQMEAKLTSLGYADCGSLRSVPLNVLQKHFGNKTGQLLYNYCRGIDDKPLHFTTVRKSISAGVNYGIRFEDYAQAETFLKQLCNEVCLRMSQNNVIGKSITVKLMLRAPDAPVETAKFMGHGFCDNITKTANLSHCTSDVSMITKEVLELCKKFNCKPEDMRGISIQVAKLENDKSKAEKNTGIMNFLKQTNGNEIVAKIVETPNEICDNLTDKTQENKEKIASEQNIRSVKAFVNDSKKSSPVKRNKSLGLTGRRRGRPPKHSTLTNSTMKVEKNTIMNSFLTNSSSEFIYENQDAIDEEFLNALPEDIKNEILASFKIKSKEPPDKQNRQLTPDMLPSCSKALPTNPANVREEIQQKSDFTIDPDYLSALPDDLRKEIESNVEMYGSMAHSSKNNFDSKQHHNDSNSNLKKRTSNDSLISNLNKRTSNSLNNETGESIEASVITEMQGLDVGCDQINEDENRSGSIMDLSCRDMRSMLRKWFTSCEDPLDSDIDVVRAYLQKQVYNKNIEELFCLMNFLYRVLNENYSCNWHKVYLELEKNMQQAMLDIYQYKLYTNTLFKCCHIK